MTLSPDGRWLAAANHAKDAPVVIWDLNVPDTAAPEHSLDAVCNLDQSGCIRRLCEKISVAIDEPQLRELVGDETFDELDSTIRQPVAKASERVLATPDCGKSTYEFLAKNIARPVNARVGHGRICFARI